MKLGLAMTADFGRTQQPHVEVWTKIDPTCEIKHSQGSPEPNDDNTASL